MEPTKTTEMNCNEMFDGVIAKEKRNNVSSARVLAVVTIYLFLVVLSFALLLESYIINSASYGPDTETIVLRAAPVTDTQISSAQVLANEVFICYNCGAIE